MRRAFSALACGLLSFCACTAVLAELPVSSPTTAKAVSPSVVDSSRIVNASVRATAGAAEKTLIAGFVISGAAEKSMLIRGVGPTLSTFGVASPLIDPTLELHSISSRRILCTNTGWTAVGLEAISATATQLGSFALSAGSKDSALLTKLPAGVYTANVFGASGDSGVALLELYDADAATPEKLVNLSARTRVGTGDDILILGFVISGRMPKRVLIRGIGPSLAPFGVADCLANPRLELHNNKGELIAANDDWGGDPIVAATMAKVGAFPLADSSKDAGLLLTLPPGVYTAHVSGVNQSTGVALVEIYEAPIADPITRWTMVNVSPNGQQADCHVIEFPDGEVAMIDVADAADAGGAALGYLRAHHIDAIDLVVISHFHRDHYGRLRDVIDAGIKVRRVAYNMPAAGATLADAEAPWGFVRAEAESLLQYLSEKNIPTYTPRPGERLIDVPFTDGTSARLEAVCLFDGANTPVGLTDTNDTSILVRLVHGTTRALFTGDLNSSVGTWLANSGYDLRADILKVPHHGTEGCAPDAFFDRVGPKVALVPSPAGLWASPRSGRIHDYFASRNIPVYVSGLNGDVTVTMDSTGFSVR